MSEEDLVVDGARVQFVRSDDGSLAVFTLAAGNDEPARIGSLELLGDGSSFVVRSLEGHALTRPSPWGGAVTAHFSSRDLAVRALLRAGEAAV